MSLVEDQAGAAGGDSPARPAGQAPAFANPDVLVPGWFVLARSRKLKPGQVAAVDVGPRRVAVYRGDDGRARAIDGLCGHLGADLGQGRVVGDRVECAFHHWQWGEDGRCAAIPVRQGGSPPARRIRAYQVEERWGLVWGWVGDGAEPAFPLPDPLAVDVADARMRVVRPPAQDIDCHPHLVVANGLDADHIDALHGVDLDPDAVSVEVPGDERVIARVAGTPRSPLLRLTTGSRRTRIEASFTTFGATLAIATITAPVRFHVIFTGRPTADGRCITQTVFFVPRSPRRALRALAIMYTLLHDDRRILEGLRFTPAYHQRDAALAAVADIAERLTSQRT